MVGFRWKSSCFVVMMILCSCYGNRIQFALTRLPQTQEERLLQTDSAELPNAVETVMSKGTGVHTVTAIVGGQKRVLIVDTGSAETAFPCASCKHCGKMHVNPLYTMKDGAEYVSCEQNDGFGLKKCAQCEGEKNICNFGQTYVEGSNWKAKKVIDSIYFGKRSDLKARVVFGCIFSEHGAFEKQTADGIMGMSRDKDAIFAQFYREGKIKSKIFSQCISATGGSMVIGGLDPRLNIEEVSYTPLSVATPYSYWTVYLESIDIGGRVLNVKPNVYNKGRGCVLDSGTTFIYIPTGAESSFKSLWADIVSSNNLYGTYFPGKNYKLTKVQLESLPKICFNMKNSVRMCIPPQQYMIHRVRGIYTSTIFFKDFAHATILGASVLMNHNIVYDVDNYRVGIAKANCDSGIEEADISLITSPGGVTFKPVYEFHIITVLAIVVACVLVLVSLRSVLKPEEEHVDYKFEPENDFEAGANHTSDYSELKLKG